MKFHLSSEPTALCPFLPLAVVRCTITVFLFITVSTLESIGYINALSPLAAQEGWARGNWLGAWGSRVMLQAPERWEVICGLQLGGPSLLPTLVHS